MTVEVPFSFIIALAAINSGAVVALAPIHRKDERVGVLTG